MKRLSTLLVAGGMLLASGAAMAATSETTGPLGFGGSVEGYARFNTVTPMVGDLDVMHVLRQQVLGFQAQTNMDYLNINVAGEKLERSGTSHYIPYDLELWDGASRIDWRLIDGVGGDNFDESLTTLFSTLTVDRQIKMNVYGSPDHRFGRYDVAITVTITGS
jgi:hypothetical protein